MSAMVSSPIFHEIDSHLNRWLVRLRWRSAALWALRGLEGGLSLALGLALAAWLRPLYTVPMLSWAALVLASAGLSIGAALGFLWPRSRVAAARRFDRLFGLAERTSTALELAAQPGSVPDWLRDDQWHDAAAAARAVKPQVRLPISIARREFILLLALLTPLALSLYLPNPQQTAIARQQAVAQAVAEQVQAIEQVRDTIQNNSALTQEQKDALTKPLDEAIQKLETGSLSPEQAVQVLSQTQQELRQLTDPNAESQAESLQQAGQGLIQNPTTQAAGQSLSSGDLQQAAQDLSNIDLSKLSEAERQALANQLAETAQQLQSTNPAVAQQLQAAADAIRAGNIAAAQSALDAAAQAIEQTGQAAAASAAASQAAAAVGTAQAAVAQASNGQPGEGQGQGQGDGQGQGQGQGEGQGQGQGQGEGEGQGQGQGEGQGQGQGQGSGSGTGQGSGDSQGGTSGTDPIGQGNGAGDGGERAYDEIYAPLHTGATGGQDVTVNGQGGSGGEVVGEGPTDTTNVGNVTVPYNEVYQGYADTAYEAVRNGGYPLDLTGVIKSYFSSLSP